MHLVYTHENRLLVINAQNLLTQAGINCRLNNEFAVGGLGELAALDTWLELYVIKSSQLPQAQALLMAMQDLTPTHEWGCTHCGEKNPSSFEVCWHCATAP